MSYDEPNNPVPLIAVVAAVVAAAAFGWFYWSDREATLAEPPAEPIAELPPEPVDEGPAYPLPPAMPERSAPETLTPLPPLSDSDRYFELELAGVLGSGIAEVLVNEALIEKVVATIDNLPRSIVSERIRPVGGLSEPFSADGQDGSGAFTMNPANYDRYDLLVVMLARADRDELVDVYRRFYPLFQEAYESLGYPDAYFNDRLVEVIDHLLETPDVPEPIALVRPHVLYEFEDPAIESRSAGQKLLIRVGSEHRVVIKQFLEDIRDRITVNVPGNRN